MSIFEAENPDVAIHKIDLNLERTSDIELFLKREDLIDAEVSGNKFRKLKYNLIEARRQNQDTLLTYGGAFSNHIAATARAGQLQGFKTIGVIRGEELGLDLAKTLQQNPTLNFAHSCGMHFHFVTRTAYREKHLESFRESLKSKYGNFYEVPEGGTNALAISGSAEILDERTANYDFIACSVGTGGTLAGIIQSSLPHQKILGFPALKGDFLEAEIKRFTSKTNWQLVTDYHFGGYAKTSEALIQFINTFREEQNIQLDPLYTGKMMYGLTDLISNGHFSKNTRILAVHTGGLQGISGMNERLRQQGRTTISI